MKACHGTTRLLPFRRPEPEFSGQLFAVDVPASDRPIVVLFHVADNGDVSFRIGGSQEPEAARPRRLWRADR